MPYIFPCVWCPFICLPRCLFLILKNKWKILSKIVDNFLCGFKKCSNYEWIHFITKIINNNKKGVISKTEFKFYDFYIFHLIESLNVNLCGVACVCLSGSAECGQQMSRALKQKRKRLTVRACCVSSDVYSHRMG